MGLLLLQVSKKISKTLESTRFKGAKIVPVAAKPGGAEVKTNLSCVIV